MVLVDCSEGSTSKGELGVSTQDLVLGLAAAVMIVTVAVK